MPSTPLMIEIALWYYCRPTDFDDGGTRFHAPAVNSALRTFCGAGLLERSAATEGVKYIATDGLKVFVDALCAVNWPVQKWLIPEGAEPPLMAPLDFRKYGHGDVNWVT